MPLNPGDTLLDGRYRILRLLGQGTAGAVYRSHDAHEGQDVVIRELPSEAAEDGVMPPTFFDAASAILHLSHRRIVRTRHVFSEGGGDYLVTDYVAGGSLDDRLREQGRLLVPEAVRIVIEVCEGLRYAHRHGVFHGDLKPSDILFDSGHLAEAAGAVKIQGLGIGPLTRGKMTHTKLPAQSLPYVAPEKFEEATDSSRMDVYALGAVLYRLVAGCNHFDVSKYQEARQADLSRRLERTPDPPSVHNLRVPAWLDGVILRALARDPEDRFPTANELRMALLEHRPDRGSGRSLTGTGVQPVPMQEDPRKPKRYWLWPIAAALLLLVVLGAAAMFQESGALKLPSLTAPEVPAGTAQRLVDDPTVEETQVFTKTAAISPASADRVVELARWGQGTTEAVAYSPDGTLLAVASALGVYVCDARTLARATFMETPQWARSIAFSPDGTLLASGLEDGTLQLWEVADGMPGTTLIGHADAVPALAFSPDGALLVSGSLDGQVRLWDAASGALVRTLEGHQGPVWRVAFSPDGATLATGSSDDTFRLWQMSDGSQRAVLEDHMGGEAALAFSPDGAILATGWENDVRLWHAAGDTLLRTLEGHSFWINDLAFSPDGATLASASADQTVRLWQVEDGREIHILEGTIDEVSSLAFSPDGLVLATSSTDEGVMLWDRTTGQLLARSEDNQTGGGLLTLSPDGSTVASGSGTAVQLRRASDGAPAGRLQGHTDWVRAVAFSPDGTLLASGADDGTVRLWSVNDGRLLDTLASHGAPVWSVAFSPDGALLASGDDNGFVYLWRVNDRQLLAELEEHTARVSALAYAPDGTTLASGDDDGLVQLWRVSDQQLQGTLQGPDDAVWSLAFSPDGALLASGPANGMARLWQVADGASLGMLNVHDDAGLSLAFSPDGALLATAGANGALHLWRVEDQAHLASLEGHRAGVDSVAFSPDGSLLFSSSYDGTVRLWGLAKE